MVKNNKWKTVAIVFIVLFALETSFIVWAFNLGVESENKELECANEICFNKNSSSYMFDSYTDTCQCFDNSKLTYQEIMK